MCQGSLRVQLRGCGWGLRIVVSIKFPGVAVLVPKDPTLRTADAHEGLKHEVPAWVRGTVSNSVLLALEVSE